MKKIFTLSLAFLLYNGLFAQLNELKLATKLMSSAIQNNDYEAIYAMTLPQFVERAGGKTRFIELLKSSQKNFNAVGLVLNNVFIGEPGSIVKAGTELHAIVPQQTTFSQKGTQNVVKNYLLAVSKDNGKTWFFFNLDGFNNDTIKTYFPNFNSSLKIPATPAPYQMNKGY